MRTGRYYIESDPEYKTSTKGNTSWPRTVREQRALVQKNGSLVFTNMTVRSVTPNADKQITQIHKFCVYEAFDKLGWLYVPFKPEQPGPHPTIKESIYILTKKLAASHNDNEQELFRAMKNMLEYMDEKSSDKQYFFGTDYFDRIWERMIDKAFGIEDKASYFPRTRWLLDYGANKVKTPLYPDSIMIFRDKYYVLDAKCYRYGWTGDADHLPNGADINKQITYGEYIERTRSVPNDKLFNAFVMPYNMADNLFRLTSPIGNIGEAIGDWRTNDLWRLILAALTPQQTAPPRRYSFLSATAGHFSGLGPRNMVRLRPSNTGFFSMMPTSDTASAKAFMTSIPFDT